MQKSYTKVKLQNENSESMKSRIRGQGAKIRSQDTKGMGITKTSANFFNHFIVKVKYNININLIQL